MKQEQELDDTLRTDLAELTALHAAPGAEQPVIARLRDHFRPLVDAVSVDHMGNLTATREGSQGGPHIVVSAHSDEIGGKCRAGGVFEAFASWWSTITAAGRTSCVGGWSCWSNRGALWSPNCEVRTWAWSING